MSDSPPRRNVEAWVTAPPARSDDGRAPGGAGGSSGDASARSRRSSDSAPRTEPRTEPKLLRLTRENAADVFARVRSGALTLAEMHVVARHRPAAAPSPSLPRDPEGQVKVLARLFADPNTLEVHVEIADA